MVGAVLGTLTLRYPIPCTRFSPYIFGGGGGIFGGGQKRVDRRFFEDRRRLRPAPAPLVIRMAKRAESARSAAA